MRTSVVRAWTRVVEKAKKRESGVTKGRGRGSSFSSHCISNTNTGKVGILSEGEMTARQARASLFRAN